MENAGYLFAAFAIVWAVTFLYILLLFNRQKSLRREIGSLNEMLEEEADEPLKQTYYRKRQRTIETEVLEEKEGE